MVVNAISFNSSKSAQFPFSKKEKEVQDSEAYLMSEERKNHPITTGVKIKTNKLVNAFTTYPQKGMEGSKNANFYEFLTMGTVPYIVGSGMLMAVFNFAAKFFDTPSAHSALKNGKKVALGVVGYGIAKSVAKKFIEAPLNAKYGIDMNLPLRKKIEEIPEESNKTNLVNYEYHNVFESVDFPRWDLLYKNDADKDRNEYFKNVGKKMGFTDEELEIGADQKVKPIIKEKIVKAKLYSMFSSYLWAANAVGVAMQKPWEDLTFNPAKIIKNVQRNKQVVASAKEQGLRITEYNWFKDFGNRFVNSCKEYVKGGSKSKQIAGKALLGAAILTTAAGIFATLNDFNINRGKKSAASTPLIDPNKEKVVC